MTARPLFSPRHGRARLAATAVGLAGSIAGLLRAGDAPLPLELGSVMHLGARTATLDRLDTLPFVDDEYTRRFQFESIDNPKLTELRQRHQLDAVVAPGRDEFDRQLLLLDWTHRQFPRFGRPTTKARGAIEILDGVAAGHSFFCSQFAEVFVSAAASLGWVDRELALRRHQGANRNGGSTEHTTTEIWSNQHRKWIMLDPTSNLFIEKNGVPLNAFEIRDEWFHRDGKDLVFVAGREHLRHRKSDLPIFLGRFPDFGNLTFDPDEPDKYGFIGYIPNTNRLDAGPDYAQMFIVKDQHCDGTRWHTRPAPANPALEPYFPIGQAALTLTPAPGAEAVDVDIRTLTPNFREFQVRLDDTGWVKSPPRRRWMLRPGTNRLEARTINRFGIEGPVSAARIVVSEP